MISNKKTQEICDGKLCCILNIHNLVKICKKIDTQTDRQTVRHKRRILAYLEYLTLSVGNAGPLDTMYLYYSYVKGAILKRSLVASLKNFHKGKKLDSEIKANKDCYIIRVYIYMCVCVCVIYILYVYTYIYIYIYILYLNIYIYVCIYIWVCVCNKD